MKKVTVEIPDDKELIFEDGEFKLVDTINIEKESILKSFSADIDALYEKYAPLLRGKFSLQAQINFVAFRSGNRRTVEHWVNNNSTVGIGLDEQSWHD